MKVFKFKVKMAGFYNRMIRRFVPLKEDASKTEENEGIKTTSNGFTYETLSTPASSGEYCMEVLCYLFKMPIFML